MSERRRRGVCMQLHIKDVHYVHCIWIIPSIPAFINSTDIQHTASAQDASVSLLYRFSFFYASNPQKKNQIKSKQEYQKLQIHSKMVYTIFSLQAKNFSSCQLGSKLILSFLCKYKVYLRLIIQFILKFLSFLFKKTPSEKNMLMYSNLYIK